MWKDFGFDIPIKEGYYWLDNGIIKAFTSDGELHKLYKYKVNDDLTINITKHKDNNPIKFHIECIESWKETYQRLKPELQTKIDESLDVIRQAVRDYSDYDFWCTTSTGKDSTVTLDLVQKVIPDIKVMFNNTSCDVADTYKIVKSHSDWVITNPKEGIYNFFKRNNFIPTRLSRACCTIYKEGASVKYFNEHNVDKLIQIMGVRNDESSKRTDREYLTQNPKWSNPNWYGLLPIRKWSDLDVWLYMLHNNLEVNSKYKEGYSRVGCGICCPYYTKSTWVLDKYWYPKLYDRWHNILQKVFLESQRWQQVNCTLAEYHVGCGAFGIYAGTLNSKNKSIWQNKSDVTDEAIGAVRDYMVQELLGGYDSDKLTNGYEWTLRDGRKVELRVTVKGEKEKNND